MGEIVMYILVSSMIFSDFKKDHLLRHKHMGGRVKAEL